MKVIKKGKISKPKYEYIAECSNCGYTALCLGAEVTFVEDRGQDYPTVMCPTLGCQHVIWCHAHPRTK
jgi:hypothetical protein